MWRVYVQQHPKIGPWYDRARVWPLWVIGPAVIAAVVAVVLPLMALLLFGLAVGLVVFLILAAVASVIRILHDAWQALTNRGGDGRRNVRVIRRD